MDKNIVTKLLCGVVPQNYLETITLSTLTYTVGLAINRSVVISDNEALETAEINYSQWLFVKYFNFANPAGDIPLTPKGYTFTAEISVPENAVTMPWIETFYFNDDLSIKYIQSYNKLVPTAVDVNINTRIIPIDLKVG